MEKLQLTFNNILQHTSFRFHRYLFQSINWDAHMIGIMGPRGVGKTTMVLQFIRESLKREDTLYVNAEDFYFSSHRLLDLAEQFHNQGGKHLFIDEIHKYKDWSRELKLIYDYFPRLQVVFTGSSVLDIAKGVSDLSRRAVTYLMQGLSYREFLELNYNIVLPVCTLNDVLYHRYVNPAGFLPLQYWGEYLKRGYYPFASDEDFNHYLLQIVNTTLENDIPQYASLSVSVMRKLKRLLAIISSSAPFKPNMTQIGGQLETSRNSIADLCSWIEKAGLIAQLRDSTGGIQGLGKVDKIYLDNANLIYALADSVVDIGTVRETFFLNQMRVGHNVVSSPYSDFLVDKTYTFEVGGAKKGQRQIKDIENSYIVRDNIETGYGNVIPLWLFGMLY